MYLFDATPLQSEHRFRGLGTYTYQLAKALMEVCQESMCFAAESGSLDLLPPDVRERAVAVRRSHRPAQVYWVYNEWFLRTVARRAQPSLFHATDFNGLVCSRDVPTIATLHDVTVLKEGLRHTDLSGRMSDLRWWVYFYRKLPKASHIIAISEAVKQDAVQWLGIREEAITVIPHGVDTTKFYPCGERERRDRPYLLFVGGRNENKNLARLLQVMAIVVKEWPSLMLRIAGSWSDSDRLWLGEQVGRWGLADHVHHLGYVEDESLPSLYANAEAFLLPSLEEGFGLPILEAMACGVPVVTSDRGAMREVAGDAALLIDPESTPSMVDAIRRILSRQMMKEQLIHRGLARAKQFSWTTAAERTLEVYERYAGRAKSSIV